MIECVRGGILYRKCLTFGLCVVRLYRNPGGSQSSPWCYVDIVINQSVEKVIELCDISKCSDKMWLYVIAPFASFTVIVFTVITIMCCRKYRKNAQRDGITNIQNVGVVVSYCFARIMRCTTNCNFDPIHRSTFRRLEKISTEIRD